MEPAAAAANARSIEQRMENFVREQPVDRQEQLRTALTEMRGRLTADAFTNLLDHLITELRRPLGPPIPPNPFPPTAPNTYTDYLRGLGDRVIGENGGMPRLTQVTFEDVVNVPGFYLVVRPAGAGVEQFLIYTHRPRVNENNDSRLAWRRSFTTELYASRRPGRPWEIFPGHVPWGIHDISRFYSFSPMFRRRHAVDAWARARGNLPPRTERRSRRDRKTRRRSSRRRT